VSGNLSLPRFQSPEDYEASNGLWGVAFNQNKTEEPAPQAEVFLINTAILPPKPSKTGQLKLITPLDRLPQNFQAWVDTVEVQTGTNLTTLNMLDLNYTVNSAIVPMSSYSYSISFTSSLPNGLGTVQIIYYVYETGSTVQIGLPSNGTNITIADLSVKITLVLSDFKVPPNSIVTVSILYFPYAANGSVVEIQGPLNDKSKALYNLGPYSMSCRFLTVAQVDSILQNVEVTSAVVTVGEKEGVRVNIIVKGQFESLVYDPDFSVVLPTASAGGNHGGGFVGSAGFYVMIALLIAFAVFVVLGAAIIALVAAAVNRIKWRRRLRFLSERQETLKGASL